MTKSESRVERKKGSKKVKEKSKLSLNKIYFWVIGVLFLILFVLVIFIFRKSGDKVDLTEPENNSSLIQDKEKQTDTTTSEDKKENEKEVSEDNNEQTTPENSEGNDALVNENAPIDETHEVDYNDGSADRIAIKEEIIKVTGLGNDLTEYWVGNNGPGRVSATVASPDKSEIYEVQLQYGEGKWHVTSYQKLDSLPGSFN